MITITSIYIKANHASNVFPFLQNLVSYKTQKICAFGQIIQLSNLLIQTQFFVNFPLFQTQNHCPWICPSLYLLLATCILNSGYFQLILCFLWEFKVHVYTAHITYCLKAVYNSNWVRPNVRHLWLPLSVHIWSHSPTQAMHEMYSETTDRPPHREPRPLLFSTSVWVL